MEKVHAFATNSLYSVPTIILLTGLFLYWQKSQLKREHKHVIDNVFIIRNSVFVGLLVFMLLQCSKQLPSFEESIYVAPADF